MLIIKNLTKIYKSKSNVTVKALDNLSLEFPKTGMVFILGKSGSGKSTLLNVLGGLDNYDSGEILIKGQSSLSFKQSHFDSYRNTYVGFIFQDYNLLDDFTVGANVALAMELQGVKPDNSRINEILHQVELDGLGARKPNELSGGQQQRVAIARALVKNPSIIMADEPTGALDSNTSKQVFDTLKDLSKDKLVIIVSHDRELSELYADRIIELKDGKVISDVSKVINIEADDSKISYSKTSIEVEPGYELTTEDLENINKYLKTLNAKSTITLKSYNHKFRFNDTNKDSIELDNSGFSLIKSKLSVKNAFKIGASSLKHKVFRLIVTIFLSIQSFTLFALADTMAAYSKNETLVKSIKDSSITYSTLSKETGNKEDYYGSSINLSKEDIDLINTSLDSYYKGVYTPSYMNTSISDYLRVDTISVTDASTTSMLNRFKYQVCASVFNGLVEFTSKDLETYNYDLVCGKLATSDNEICVSDYIYKCFNILGYYDESSSLDNKIVKINSYSDLVGKKIKLDNIEFSISGIIDTHFDLSRYEDLYINDNATDTELIINYILLSELNYAKNYSLIGSMFVNEGYINKLIEEHKTSFTSFSYSYMTLNNELVNTENYFNCISSVSLLTEPVVYHSLNNQIDSSHVAIDPVSLTNLLIDYEEIYTDSLDPLNTKLVIEGVEEDSKNYIMYLSPTSKAEACMYSLIVKYAYDLYSNNKTLYNDFAGTSSFDEVISDLHGMYYKYSDSTNKEVTNKLDKFVAENIFNEFDKLNIDYKKTFKLSKGYYDENKKSVYVIGVVYNINYPYAAAIVTDDNTFADVATINYGDYSFAVSNMPSSEEGIRKIVEFSSKFYDIDDSKQYKYSLLNSASYEVEIIDNILKVAKQIFFYVGLFFAVFATLLLSNFIATSIVYKKKDIGILRAIGSRSIDVFKIFFAESLIIALIDSVLTSILTTIIVVVANNAIRAETGILVTILNLSIRQILVILAISVGISFIATLLPVYKIASKRPVAAIKNCK